jgi:competence protein ComEA
VAGAVAIPGVYTLHPDDRIVDAIAAAGGETPEAESSRLNLAQRVQDGARYYVPELAEEFPPDAAPGPPAAGGTPPANGLIDLNNASGAVLETLPGIGPALAGAIVSYRESNGPFQSVEELVNVPRIGPLTLGKIRLLVTVSAVR